MTRRCPPPRSALAGRPVEAEPLQPDLARVVKALRELVESLDDGGRGDWWEVKYGPRLDAARSLVAELPAPVPPDLDDTRPRSLHVPEAPLPFGAGPMIEHGANDLETFRAFFGSLGVPFEEVGATRTMPATAVAVLWVAGASFAFDAAGTFLGISRTGQAATFIARTP